ncbi:hypothetical protein N007_09420 [Alicyclobacillus acidoterrestris ATCC 49025]|nr:hypothetical protein N007_09420 [Alicyclobacillus acidoterrestris ATCC 49025]
MEQMDEVLQERLSEIIEWLPDGVYVADGQGFTLLVNSAYEALSGTHRQNLIGKHMAELIETGYINQSVTLLILESRQPMSLIQTLKSGKEVIVTGNPVFDKSGNIRFIVTSVRDITSLNHVTAELEKVRGLSALNKHQYHFNVNGNGTSVIMESRHMKAIVEKVKQIALYPTSVLLSGPSGVGKEVIANLIHELSARSQKPFVKVNCAAIPEALLESELFGYEPGSFTGARREGKVGLFELADGGTILLDEIGEMPLSIQVKLLRVLQDLEIFRVGGVKSRKVDIRVISATNQDLRALVEQRKFREDLYYRLQVVEFHIPPLSERPEDVDALIDYYFHFYCTRYRIEKRLREDTRTVLCQYNWPGNVRELKNLMENLIVSVPSLVIDPDHLPFHVQSKPSQHRVLTIKQQLEKYERRIVAETLNNYSSIRKAAEVLGLDHSTLVKKLKRWDISTESRFRR